MAHRPLTDTAVLTKPCPKPLDRRVAVANAGLAGGELGFTGGDLRLRERTIAWSVGTSLGSATMAAW